MSLNLYFLSMFKSETIYLSESIPFSLLVELEGNFKYNYPET